MIWYKSKDDNRLINLSRIAYFWLENEFKHSADIMGYIAHNGSFTEVWIESFQGDNAQAKAEAFIRWLSTIIADSEITNFVYDDSSFLQFACDEIEEEVEK